MDQCKGLRNVSNTSFNNGEDVNAMVESAMLWAIKSLNNIENVENDQKLYKFPPFYYTFYKKDSQALLGLEYIEEHQLYNNERLNDVYYICNLCYPDKKLVYHKFMEYNNCPTQGEDITCHISSDAHIRAYLAVSDTTYFKKWDNLENSNESSIKHSKKNICSEFLGVCKVKHLAKIQHKGRGPDEENNFMTFGEMFVTIEGMGPELLMENLMHCNNNYRLILAPPRYSTKVVKHGSALITIVTNKDHKNNHSIPIPSIKPLPNIKKTTIEQLEATQIVIISELKTYMMTLDRELASCMYPGMDSGDKWKKLDEQLNSMLLALK